jgi:hypothetical protein
LLVAGIKIPCRYYSVKELNNILSKKFTLLKVTTYLNSLLAIEHEILSNSEVSDYYKRIDTELMQNGNATGYYISCVLKKGK